MKRSELVEEIVTRLLEPHSEMLTKWTRQRNSGNHPALSQAVEWAAETIADYVEEKLLTAEPPNPRGTRK